MSIIGVNQGKTRRLNYSSYNMSEIITMWGHKFLRTRVKDRGSTMAACEVLSGVLESNNLSIWYFPKIG